MFLFLALLVPAVAQLRGFNSTLNSTLNSTFNSTLSAPNSPDYTNSYIATGVLVPIFFLCLCWTCGMCKPVPPSRFY
jgi:hypothetical protein